jgi:hypothetical protein
LSATDAAIQSRRIEALRCYGPADKFLEALPFIAITSARAALIANGASAAAQHGHPLPRQSVSNYQMREYRVKDRLGWAYAPVT